MYRAIDYLAAVFGSFLYCSRVWPATTMFLFVLIGRLIDWPGIDGAATYLYGIALLLACLFLTWRGDDFIDIGSKAFVDMQSGWKELSSGFLDRHQDMEYVPVNIIPAEGNKPLVVLPSGLRAFLPPMGDILAYWVRVPATIDPTFPRPRTPKGPRAYPFASYRNYVFLPFSPEKATTAQRFQLYHEIGHSLYSRSFQSISQVQTWPCLTLLTTGTLVVANSALAPTLTLIAILVLWQSITLLRSTPNFERARFSEFLADFYAMLYMRDVQEIYPFLEQQIKGLRASHDASQNHRADDLEMLLKNFKPASSDSVSTSALIDFKQSVRMHKGLVRMGSQHPQLLVLLLAICLTSTGISLARIAPEAMLIFAVLYALIPYLIWRFGTGRRNALEAARVDRFLRERRPTDATPESVSLVFS
jgi:hypothetical protein